TPTDGLYENAKFNFTINVRSLCWRALLVTLSLGTEQLSVRAAKGDVQHTSECPIVVFVCCQRGFAPRHRFTIPTSTRKARCVSTSCAPTGCRCSRWAR